MPRYSPRTGQLQEYQVGPYNMAHLYCQWGGKLPGGESWSNGLRFKSVAAANAILTPNDQNAMITAVKTAIQAFHVRAGSMISTECQLSFVKLNTVHEDGTYAIDSTTQQVVADVGGGGGQNNYPNQVCLAVTLETGYSRGPAHRGRFYIPIPAITVAGLGGFISTADATAVKTSTTTLLTALNAVNANFKVAVFSRKAGAPADRLVTGISVGKVLDTQRRRRRNLLETWV